MAKKVISIVRQSSQSKWRQPETIWNAEYLRIVVVYDDGTSKVVATGNKFDEEHWKAKMKGSGRKSVIKGG
jgi:hypothetical protein